MRGCEHIKDHTNYSATLKSTIITKKLAHALFEMKDLINIVDGE